MPHTSLRFDLPEEPEILCIGAHCDDIEIGCGGTILRLLESHPNLHMTWLVLTGNEQRQAETRAAAGRLLAEGNAPDLILHRFRDGFLPYETGPVKDAFESARKSLDPHLVLSHWCGDAHQDHRLVSELTWNTYRRHLILEYEIPKYDGDLGRPNVFVPLSDEIADRKVDCLLESFQSQSGKPWFDGETFRSLLRMRGIESGSDCRYAEGFYSRKTAVLG